MTAEVRKLVTEQFRRWMQVELDPRTADFESGRELPYALMRRMVQELGLAEGADRLRAPKQGEPSDAERESAALRAFAATQLTVEMCRINPGYALSFGASQGLYGGALLSRGTPEQIARYMPAIRRVERIGCWCLTEPGAGSDALGAMRTRARRDGGEWVLDGEKTFITNAPFADDFLVYAKDDEGQVQAYLVERGAKGLTTSPPFDKMGMKSSPTGSVHLEGVRVPEANLLGGGSRDRDHVRKSLSSERVGLAAMSYGIAERCFELALDYAKTRVQGGKPIGEHQLVQARLARMYVALSNARRVVYGEAPLSALDASAGKLYVAEVGTQVALDAIHVLGGNGYMAEYVVERLARDAKLIEIGGGTTEIQLLTIGKLLMQQTPSS